MYLDIYLFICIFLTKRAMEKQNASFKIIATTVSYCLLYIYIKKKNIYEKWQYYKDKG